MKTATCSLLICVFLLQLMVPVNTDGTLDIIGKKKVKELLAHQDNYPSAVRKTLSCTNVKSMSKWASCPAGMTATGCSCGFACGSWEIQNENICNCLCLIVDWAYARCCQLS
ncbi:rCG52958 [Rattus norvegicus]|uniref:Resistin-like alpha n=3 Tax=Rattus norvegicus TaxID=10116 RepID=RETNA_RAT|nr:resistin-like alpha precursor [Rattus norvegicus]XP_006248345.1 resistin-like alpha isoform X1 [Rattus norvegicus]Q99P85.1 RecName: Full=Resistin-like alpha; AltName: Full=Cysteine-rich secreted protein FIZZ1; AltName: Full=RELMalpha; Flags: Precursor [Rattus norvegicus]AAG59828.1 resistin-like molecule alpha [Rattus norvegicus]EDM11109.1 rCG52958 [Rattus norvegicus]|eukprot:NP_445785.1 resistin-like alpha precursor [Rattus norvegicus]